MEIKKLPYETAEAELVEFSKTDVLTDSNQGEVDEL